MIGSILRLLPVVMPMVRNVARVGAGVAMSPAVVDTVADIVGSVPVPDSNADPRMVIAGFIGWAVIELWYYFAKRLGWKT